MIVDIKGVGKAQFPDDMPIDDVRSFLQKKYYQQNTQGGINLDPAIQTAQPYNPSLAERAGGAIAQGLKGTGLISDNYGAQQIGKNIASLGEMLPGIGDATAGDEFGRAAAEGNLTGMGWAGLGVIPVVGDAAKKGSGALSDLMADLPKFSDKVEARRNARLDVFDLPTKGKPENIKHITDLMDYTPEQLVSQLKLLDQSNIKQGGYLKKGDGLDVFYKNDGTSQMIDPKTNEVIFEQSREQTENLAKNDILEISEGKLSPEQRKIELDARKRQQAEGRAREEAQQETYKMQHTAPMREGNSVGYDLTSSFGDDIYTGNAVRYFGGGTKDSLSMDTKAVNIIQGMKGKPEKSVTIYRAVPKKVKDINPSDWVTTTKEYALGHMKGEKGWHILSKKVKAKDIATDGNSIHEFGYDPE